MFERALDVDYKNHSLWLKYVEMEMKNRFINHARNLWDRAVQLLPRVNQFWCAPLPTIAVGARFSIDRKLFPVCREKYAFMEENLGNVAGARTVFERWLKWEPEAYAWLAYVKLETRFAPQFVLSGAILAAHDPTLHV